MDKIAANPAMAFARVNPVGAMKRIKAELDWGMNEHSHTKNSWNQHIQDNAVKAAAATLSRLFCIFQRGRNGIAAAFS